MIEESGHVAIIHCIDAKEISHGFRRAVIGYIIRIIAEKVQIEEVCYSLRKLESVNIRPQTVRSYSSPRRSASASVMTSPRYRHINIPLGIGRHVRTPILSRFLQVCYPILSYEF